MKLAKSFDFMYLGVHGGMETNETFQKVKNAIVRLKPNKIWVHVSIPCSSRSLFVDSELEKQQAVT